jgi:hypothetical protein
MSALHRFDIGTFQQYFRRPDAVENADSNSRNSGKTFHKFYRCKILESLSSSFQVHLSLRGNQQTPANTQEGHF